MEQLSQHIEGLIFSSTQPISIGEIKSVLESTFENKFKNKDLVSAIGHIQDRYREGDFAFEVVEIAGGYQFLSKGTYHNSIGTYLRQTMKKRLSRAALETLAIIAYKQPVTKSEMETIRGVSCDYAVQKLLEKELIDMQGRSEGPGRPLLYGTSQKFMDYFGLGSLDDMPKLKDFKQPDSVIGEAAPIEEFVGYPEATKEDLKQLPDAESDVQLIADEIASIQHYLYGSFPTTPYIRKQVIITEDDLVEVIPEEVAAEETTAETEVEASETPEIVLKEKKPAAKTNLPDLEGKQKSAKNVKTKDIKTKVESVDIEEEDEVDYVIEATVQIAEEEIVHSEIQIVSEDE